MAVTPSGTGGRPTAVHSSSAHASTWAFMSGTPCSSVTGVQDARTSSWAVASSSAIPPKLSVATLVTVPDAATYDAPCASRASVNQVQPTPASIGSLTSSGSISARA